MAVRPLVLHPDPRLREVCAPVPRGADHAALIADLFETLYAAGGRGLAAPQIGVGVRVFVMDAWWKTGGAAPIAFVNPRIAGRAKAVQIGEEACLSIPGQARRVARPDWVELDWTDAQGATRHDRFAGIEAAIVCHEIDHLDGILILDHPDMPE
ncbi:MAG: peptide deformylase [Rhodobacteraceae bacterium HLUCCA08]|nr:MAG: peptide deformylase [Rhodobacteraceae bacterium HLUCCA08]